MSGQSGERRAGPRRGTDRRNATGRRRDDLLFDSQLSAALSNDSLAGADTFFDPGWLAAGEHPLDSRSLLRHAQRLAAAQDTALVRVFRTYTAARAAIGAGLVAVLSFSTLLGLARIEAMAWLSVAYAVQAITLWLLPRFKPLADPRPQGSSGRRRQWLATIGVDLVAFLGLHILALGSSFNYGALLVLPVLMAGVLTSRLVALGTAAGVALALLAVAWRVLPAEALVSGLMVQTGLAGLGLFIITVLSGELAGRLAREEVAARGSLELARQQAQLNRLVIEEMADGVLVVDPRLRVRAANPAARALLVDAGLSPPAPFSLGDRDAWHRLHDDVQRAFSHRDWPEAGRDVVIAFEGGLSRTLRVRVRFTRARVLEVDAPPQPTPAPASADGASGPDTLSGEAPERDAEPFIVLLLEDAHAAQARLRQEKLAAMGRVSAGIAHEIRNPLAAIAQANALLQEDGLSADQARLARIVADNVTRLKRLLDDVAEMAPGSAPASALIDARATVAEVVADWAATAAQPLAANSRLITDLAAGTFGVLFDADHLRRVIVNLLDNAHRHAAPEPGAIVVRLVARDDTHLALTVSSRGEPIAPDVERYLFEPFFSTRSRGSGLGLYICRELCERHGASIEFTRRGLGAAQRNEFVVMMRRAELPDPAQVLPLET